MNHHDIIDLLTTVRAGDNRTVGQGDVEMWLAVIADVPKAFAMDAVIAHRRERPGVWLEPGHIAERWEARRRDQVQRSESPLSIEASTVTADGADNGIGIEKRELKNGDHEFRFFCESHSGQAACGLWRSTVGEARRDGQNWQSRTVGVPGGDW